jgi:hypothetical protein
MDAMRPGEQFLVLVDFCGMGRRNVDIKALLACFEQLQKFYVERVAHIWFAQPPAIFWCAAGRAWAARLGGVLCAFGARASGRSRGWLHPRERLHPARFARALRRPATEAAVPSRGCAPPAGRCGRL